MTVFGQTGVTTPDSLDNSHEIRSHLIWLILLVLRKLDKFIFWQGDDQVFEYISLTQSLVAIGFNCLRLRNDHLDH